MNCVVWNARGLGNQRAFGELKRLVAEKKPNLLFLSETRRRNINRPQWQMQLGYTGCFSVDCVGRSGGLCLLWMDSLSVTVTSFSAGHIDCSVIEGTKNWRFTGFYGNPNVSHRLHSWELLRRLRGIRELAGLPWLVGGDFNEICFDSEKVGGNPRTTSQMQGFRDALDDCDLQDLHCRGELFTWANRRMGNQLILERLDRFVGTLEWRLMYPTTYVQALKYFHSDHRPLYLCLGGQNSTAVGASNKHEFIPRFESSWLRERECNDIVVQGWRPFDDLIPLHDRISNCLQTLQHWARIKLGSLPRRIKEKRAKMNALKNHENWPHATSQVYKLETELEQLVTQDEEYWRQRSRINWVQGGVRNSKFFHAHASSRRNVNTIRGLITAHGDLCSEPQGMAEIITEYFTNLFDSNGPSPEDMSHILECVQAKVTQQMNLLLCAPFTAREVKKALFDMHPDKSHGPDGMSALFYQKFWHIVGRDVTAAALAVLNEDAPLDNWNQTVVTFIPKVANPLFVKEFRPISLCNVCYKIVSRALTSRLRQIMNDIIDDHQNAFVSGRLISDNIILGFEAIH
ncbi:uncharacterized protein [Primulina huaijiensis]|uniref:uncharacterized protein n=1 Tax=Primulina huaijiensis TaxID=1492673 RepID=UPI003CC70A75